MAGESSGLWSNLPSIIVVEIFSKLNLTDRINASSVCKTWRYNLFHPKLWRKVIFHLDSCDKNVTVNQNKGARFLAEQCGLFVQEAVINLNSLYLCNNYDCEFILEILSRNYNLRALSIKPRSSLLTETGHPSFSSFAKRYATHIIQIIKQARCLEHLSLGLLRDVLNYSYDILEVLNEHQALNIRSLHLSSSSNFEVLNRYLYVSHPVFQPFFNLEHLSIDYNSFTDSLIDVLAQPGRKPLKCLCINLHDYEIMATSVNAWMRMISHSPQLEVTINVLRLRSGLTRFLHPVIPVTHLRFYFTDCLTAEILMRFAMTYAYTLQSLVLVRPSNLEMPTFVTDGLDPLVILAWRCSKLSHLKIIGYEVAAESLIGIARLRGEKLRCLEVPISCIYFNHVRCCSKTPAVQHVMQEISCALQRPWEPTPAYTVPKLDTMQCFDNVYLQELLTDQIW